MKRIFIVHGWGASPREDWFPWLKTELEKHGFVVITPKMPDTHHPRIDAWVKHLAEVVNMVDLDTYFVGHSIGCQTILRYLASLPAGSKVGGAVFVAGWFTLMGLPDYEWPIAESWLKTPIAFERVRAVMKTAVAFFSDDDPVVPLENEVTYREKVGANTFVEHAKGHYNGSDGFTEVPEVLEALLRLVR